MCVIKQIITFFEDQIATLLYTMYQKQIDAIKDGIFDKLKELSGRELEIEIKDDRSPVSEMDLFISDLVKKIFLSSHPEFNFFSEEDHQVLEFPAIVLDPLDGTEEFSRGIPEWAVSLAVMHSPQIDHPQNFGWIFNPCTGLEVKSTDQFLVEKRSYQLKTLSGLVSRREWFKGGIRESKSERINLLPRGSIAFKLGLLAVGAADFVFTRRPKNIWDVAAGTLINHRRGIFLWDGGDKLVEKLDDVKLESNLLWIHQTHLPQLKKERGLYE